MRRSLAPRESICKSTSASVISYIQSLKNRIFRRCWITRHRDYSVTAGKALSLKSLKSQSSWERWTVEWRISTTSGCCPGSSISREPFWLKPSSWLLTIGVRNCLRKLRSSQSRSLMRSRSSGQRSGEDYSRITLQLHLEKSRRRWIDSCLLLLWPFPPVIHVPQTGLHQAHGPERMKAYLYRSKTNDDYWL